MFSLSFQVTGTDEIHYTLVIECDGRGRASTGADRWRKRTMQR